MDTSSARPVVRFASTKNIRGHGDGGCDGGKNASGGDFERARDALAAGLPVPAHRPRKDRARVVFLASGLAFGSATLRAMAHRVERDTSGICISFSVSCRDKNASGGDF